MSNREASRVVLLYVIVSAAWICCSDWLVEQLGSSVHESMIWSSGKGLLYVALSAAMLWVTLRRVFDRLFAYRCRLRNAQLRAGSTQKYSDLLIESAPIGIITYRASGQAVSANPAAARMVGTTVEQLTRQNFRELESWKKAGLLAAAELALETRKLQSIDIHLSSTFGREIKMSAQLIPFDHNGELHLMGLFVDITASKAAEEALKESERFARSTLNSLSASIAILGSDGRILEVNRSWIRFAEENSAQTGLVCEGANYLEICARAVGEGAGVAREFAEGIRSVIEGGQQKFQIEYSCDSPTQRRWFVGRVTRFAGDGPVRVVVSHEDITARKLAEISLRETEAKFHQLAQNIDSVFWICDRDKNRMYYVSPAYEKIWGRSCESLYADPMSFTEAIHPDDRGRIRQAMDEQQQRGGAYNVEYRIVRADGQLRWIRDRGFLIRNEAGRFYRACGLAEDFTERRQLEEHLRQAQKMEAIGQLASGVAHDFNNILSAILLQLGLLQMDSLLNAELKESLKDIESEAHRAANLTRQLLLFSRRQEPKVEPLDVNELIEGLLKMLRRLLGENIDVSFERAPDALSVKADAGMLEQVVMNLCINARDAMPQGGKLVLATSAVEREGTPTEKNPGTFIRLEVTDNGCGMDAVTLGHIFEPFFTTKEIGKGTGLGLATVYGIVRDHGGWIEVNSEPGKGSSFYVYLPAAERRSAPLAAAEVGKCAAGCETILFAEDDASLRRKMSLCLRKLGYAVLEAGNAADALALWETHHERIDLLFTDMLMPQKLTGLDLAEKLLEKRPGLSVIIASGYTSDIGKIRAKAGLITFLNKPFSPAVLAATIRQCLEQKNALTNRRSSTALQDA